MKVYVVTGSEGQYSDHTEWNIVAMYDEERAKELVSKLQRLSKYNKEISDRLWSEFHPSYKDSIDVPSYPAKPEPTEEFKALLRVKKNTPELKEIFRKLEKEHLSRIEAWNKEYNEIGKLHSAAAQRKLAAQETWRKENYHPPSDLKDVAQYVSGYGAHYSYEELDVI